MIISKIFQIQDLNSFKNLSEFISYNIQNLDELDHYINQEASKDLILDIISGLNFKTDEQNIFDQFRYFLELHLITTD